jgi:hypothetical protein
MQAGIMPPARVDDPVVERLRALYQQFPNEDLADLQAFSTSIWEFALHDHAVSCWP